MDSPPDDIRTFIKDEPHKIEKVQAGRLRLIMVISLEDQMVDRLLFHHWSETELRNCLKIPGKTGWTPIPFGYRVFNQELPRDWLATDCSSFDWTFPSWLPNALLRLRKDLSPPQSKDYWDKVYARYSQVLERAVVRLPTGERFIQIGTGLMKSGWFRTISENSAAQVLINLLAWLRAGFEMQDFPRIWTMGDDVILAPVYSDEVQELENALATTGIVVKQSTDAPEFGGFRISGSRVDPLYPDKHDFMLRYVEPRFAAETARAFTMLYALSQVEYANTVAEKIEPHSDVPRRLAAAWAHGVLSLSI
uniref:RNA-dependent RNA polymerase n=1 Tax=Prorhinotermes simplex sobeli-like virus 1 TaxID=3133517 RepID=A0AAT9JH82_9VIRU